MAAYAVAHMRQVTMGPQIVECLQRIDATLGPQIVECLQRIDATLEPFGGRFLVHGGDMDVAENEWPGHLIVIEFPDRAHAWGWYDSSAYREILALRTDNSHADVIIADGVQQPHKATDVLE
ncbi:hypothetical protein X760_14270 [Mesorhizobium sp. LSHC422A00]|uniref:DUF1330 domain-containing protein n=1 Tax=Mesorhizobium sp. LSHC422A00 TaxID=1287294 RepID=UPI0003CDF321|nr:DUF1330 domain-containing protein [Mesorhizobium sp. LSHC422A00]ESX60315.1 hypothetical protein X760_14270 [Mesorhizobium sp. LSHC422A00]